MTEPRTAAGKRLLAIHHEKRSWPSLRNDPDAQAAGYLHYCDHCFTERRYPCQTVTAILAIESEAGALDAAWARAEAALPEGWQLGVMNGVPSRAWAYGGGEETIEGEGSTPADALNALADRLSEAQ